MRSGLVFIMLTMFSMTLFGQLQVNGYAKVDLIAGTTLNCSYLDETYDSFEAGDIIMVYQVQDNVLGGNTGNNATFGNVSNIKNAGVIEFAEISNVSKNGANMVIVMSDFLDESFSNAANSSVQVITFPEFPDFVTADDITGKAWDGNTGGVIAFNVPGLFTLKNDIFADGIGFRGGSESDNSGISCDVGTYRTGNSNYGGKGESIYKISSSQMHYGKGKVANGAGGGNPHNGALHYLTFGGDLGELLPVELVSFGVDCEDNKHRIFWTTASEINNDYFLLHASNDGKEWKEVNRIAGAGTSYHTLDYELYLTLKNNYYRLTQVDFDGSKEVFEVVVANCASSGEKSAIEDVYYDGVDLNMEIRGFSGQVQVLVSNGIARPVYHNTHTVDEFNQSFKFPVNLKSGMYIVTLMQNGDSVSKKMLVF